VPLAMTCVAALTATLLKAQDTQAGQTLYQSNCAGCHGLDGRGGEHAPDIATSAKVRQLTAEDLIRIIRNGISGSAMPSFATRLSQDQNAVIARYLRRLQGFGQIPAVAGDPERGRDLFFGKAGCSECHMAAGAGGFLAHDLSSYGGTHSPQEIREAILDPSRTADPRRSMATVTAGDGREYTGVIRNEDNWSLQVQGTDGAFYLFQKPELVKIARDTSTLMPADYGSKLSPREIDDLIRFLGGVAENQPKSATENSKR